MTLSQMLSGLFVAAIVVGAAGVGFFLLGRKASR
jgi:hypothetical protein